MFSSVQAGAAAVPDGSELLPAACGLPTGASGDRRAAGAGAALSSGAAITLPVYGGAPGHPPLLAPEVRAEILAAHPDGGLRELLLARPDRVLHVRVDDPGVLHDADTPADLEALRARAVREELPSEPRCLELLREQGAGDALVAHSVAVAAVATALAAALNERRAAPVPAARDGRRPAARRRPRGAAGTRTPARTCSSGSATRASCRSCARHMRLGEAAGDPLDEAQVVYLADKLVPADRVVGLEERFAARLRQVGGDDAAGGASSRAGTKPCGVLARVESRAWTPRATDVAAAPATVSRPLTRRPGCSARRSRRPRKPAPARA